MAPVLEEKERSASYKPVFVTEITDDLHFFVQDVETGECLSPAHLRDAAQGPPPHSLRLLPSPPPPPRALCTALWAQRSLPTCRQPWGQRAGRGPAAGEVTSAVWVLRWVLPGPRIYSPQSLSGSNEQIVCVAGKHEPASVGRWVEEGNLGSSAGVSPSRGYRSPER